MIVVSKLQFTVTSITKSLQYSKKKQFDFLLTFITAFTLVTP